MHKITFAQAGIAGITHTAVVAPEQYDEWLAYAARRGHIVIVDKLLTV